MDDLQGKPLKNQNPFLSTRFRHWIGGVLVEMRRKSPVQQWVDSISPQQSDETSPKPIKKSTSHDDISVTEEVHDTASIKLDSDSESTKENRSSSPISCQSRHTETKEENDCDESVDNSIENSANDSGLDKDSNSAKKINENGSCSNSETLRSPVSDENEQKDRVYMYSKSVDSGTMLERTSKAPLVRDRSVNSEGNSPKHFLRRDSSLQSDASRASSVESLLEARKVDAEAVLRGVGFGPSLAKQQLARIPDRFLQPSKVKGVSTEQFIQDEQKSIKLHECGIFGYKGLTGDPYTPKSTIVTKIIERISSREAISDQQLPPMPRSRRNTNAY